MTPLARLTPLFTGLLATTVLVACGGEDPAPAPTRAVGVMVDGYIRGGSVFCDLNNNDVRDANEEQVTTDANGQYALAGGCNANVVGFGGVDNDTGYAFQGQLKTPPGSTVMTPLTTLLAGTGLTRTELATLLGLPANTDVTTIDIRANNQTDLLKRSLAVQQIITNLARIVASQAGLDVRTAFTQVARGLGAQLAALPNTTVLLDSSGNIDSVVLAATVVAVPAVASLGLSPSNLSAALEVIEAEAELLAQASDDQLGSLQTDLQNPDKLPISTGAASSYYALAGDALKLNGANVTIDELSNGARTDGLATIGMELTITGTPDSRVTASVALDLIEQGGDGRKLQLMLDKVEITLDAQNQIHLEVPENNRVHAYGHTANGTDINLTFSDLTFKPISIVNNSFTLNYTNMVKKVLASVNNTTRTTAERFSAIRGTFAVRLVISNLNIRRTNASSLGVETIGITNTNQRVTGFGISGTLVIG